MAVMHYCAQKEKTKERRKNHMQSISNRLSKSPARLAAGFLRILVLSLLTAAFICTSLHAQSVAYVANTGSNNVSVFDFGSNMVMETFLVEIGPAMCVFSPTCD